MLNNYKKYILFIVFVFISIFLFSQSNVNEFFDDYILGGESWNNDCHRNSIYLSDQYENCNNGEYVLSFEDNFNGNALDEIKWEIKSGVIRDFDFNLAKQWLTPDNIEVADGTLKLWARLERKAHTYWDPTESDNYGYDYFDFGGAEIWTNQKFMHGKYEIKCRMPESEGLWPAFWMYEGENNGEIDVFDNINGVENIHCGMGYDYDNDNHEGCRMSYDQIPDLTEWHIFTLIYDDDKISWIVDGEILREEYYKISNTGIEVPCGTPITSGIYHQHMSFPMDYMSVILTMTVRSKSSSPNINDFSSACLEVDYIKIWEKKDEEEYDCCLPYKLYENTDELPSQTSVDGYIKAGKNIGVDGVNGDIVVKPGQNVKFAAGNKIELLPGFVAEEGSNFVAEIKDCDNDYFDDDIIIKYFPDSFSPDNDGNNDHLNVEVYGATHYDITVRDKLDINTYYKASNIPVYSNHINVWDGNCNYTGNCWFYQKCNRKRKVYLRFKNCNNEKYKSKTVDVNCEEKDNKMADTVQLNSKNTQSNDLSDVGFEIFPNPSRGIFNVRRTGNQTGTYSLKISNVLGKVIYQKSTIIADFYEIDISNRPPGTYYLNIIDGKNLHQKDIILF